MDVIYGRGFLVQISLAIGQEKISQGRIQEYSVAHRFDPEAFSDCLDGCK